MLCLEQGWMTILVGSMCVCNCGSGGTYVSIPGALNPKLKQHASRVWSTVICKIFLPKGDSRSSAYLIFSSMILGFAPACPQCFAVI